MITLVNLGLGNIDAFCNVFKRLAIPFCIANSEYELRSATKIILPGVGSFDWAMTRLVQSGMRECLDELVLVQKRPVLGVCVGMQLMAHHSDEGSQTGLSWIDAAVKKFDVSVLGEQARTPHMGWNRALVQRKSPLFHALEDPRFYFLHSYYMATKNTADVLTTTDYNGSFVSSVSYENIFGVQFHPEKSHRSGIQLLKNFAEM